MPAVGVLLGITLFGGQAQAATSFTHLGEFGGSGTGDHQFRASPMPQRVAVHFQSGKVFVADRGNHRISVFESTSGGVAPAFTIPSPAPVGLAIDQSTGDLYASNGAVLAVNEVQRIQILGSSSGTYTLTFDGETTAPIPFDAIAADVRQALEALPTIGAGNITLTGAAGNNTQRLRNVTFTGTLAGSDVDLIEADTSGLNPEAQINVTVTTEGVAPVVQGLRKYNPDQADDPGSYSPDPDFVSPPNGVFFAGEVGGYQSGAVNVPSGGGIAVDPRNGELLIADVGRNLVQRFDSDGGFINSFNGFSTARPAFTGLRDIAVTDAGDIITADVSGSNARVDRFGPDGSHAAALSVANNPVPNPYLSGGDSSGIVVAAVPGTGEVLVSSSTSAGFIVNPIQIFQFEDDELVGSFNSPSFNFRGHVFGMAMGAGRLYALGGHTPQGTFGSPTPYVQVFRAILPPVVSLDPAQEVTATEARLSGTIDPHGEQVDWRFRYRPVGATDWSSVPVPDGVTDTAGPVSETISGLEPNTEYEFTLSAGIGGVVGEAGPLTFTTEVEAPHVDTGIASDIGAQQATLNGGVNPRNLESSYRFEWGETTAYGNVVPSDPVSVGDGGERVAVSELLTGLEPGATYHYRLVAENDDGDVAAGEDMTFTALAAPQGGLQAERGFELTTRQPMGIPIQGRGVVVSEDGNSAHYRLFSLDPLPPGEIEPKRVIRADRAEDRWDFHSIDIPHPDYISYGYPVYTSLDFNAELIETRLGLDPADQNDAPDMYLRRAGSDPIWISRSDLTPEGEPQVDPAAVGVNLGIVIASRTNARVVVASPAVSAMSESGDVVVFGSRRRILESDPNPSDPADTRAGTRLYKWADGELSLLSVRPDQSAPTGPNVVLGSRAGTGNGQVTSPRAVSRDGSRIFWSDGTTIFAHIEGEPTKVVGDGLYADASEDGSRVFYTANGRLYAFEVDSGVRRDITGHDRVQGLASISADGRKVYFTSRAALDAEGSPQGEVPIEGRPNLYLTKLSEDGVPEATRLIAVLGAGNVDEKLWHARFTARPATASPDGRVLAFASATPLTGRPTAGFSQMFVYDDEASSLVCASCPADGSLPAPDSVNHPLSAGGIPATGDANAWQYEEMYKRLVSEDGTVLFDTATKLDQGDENDVRDVYEYRNGEIRLISPGGAGDTHAQLAGASRDGSTAFFISTADIDPRDSESGMRKLWAARVGGGFPYHGETPGCAGTGCEGAIPPTPAAPVTGSLAFQGRGNATPATGAPAARLAVRRLGRGVRAGLLRVTVSGPGRIVVNGPGVRRAVRNAPRAGSYRVRVRLRPRLLRLLARRPAVAVRTRVIYRPRGSRAVTRNVNLRVRRAATGRRGR